jgi:hypothetical protein
MLNDLRYALRMLIKSPDLPPSHGHAIEPAEHADEPIIDYPTVAENRETVITSLAKSKNVQGTVTNVTVLGPIQPGRLTWSMQDDGLHVTQPTYKPNDLAWVVKIEGLKLN